MKRIIIVCEGKTEREFCDSLLLPYLSDKQIYIETPTINGIKKWESLKYQILKILKEDKTAFVTTLIDYYGIYANNEFPNWESAHKLADKNKIIEKIESGMKDCFNEEFRHRFIPYIQLHEFEGLLFSEPKAFEERFEKSNFLDKNYLFETLKEFSNPEMINNSFETAPSRRLSKILKNYSKINDGVELAQLIGLDKIRSICPRFNEWIIKLETF